MCLKLQEEIRNLFAPINLIGDDSKIAFELFLFTSNIRREVCGVLDYFLFLKKNMKKKKFTTCFLCYTLKPSSSIFFCWPRRKWKYIYVMNEYDRRTLYPMILKCYHHLHPMTNLLDL